MLWYGVSDDNREVWDLMCSLKQNVWVVSDIGVKRSNYAPVRKWGSCYTLERILFLSYCANIGRFSWVVVLQ